MKREIMLVDYKGTRQSFTIDNFEDVLIVEIRIISGDEIARIIYKDKKVVEFDSSDCRIMGYSDGIYILPLERLDEFNAYEGSSYARQREFDND